MRAPDDDNDTAEGPQSSKRASPDRGVVESDFRCPWCGGTRLRWRRKAISPRGFGIIAYIFFPFALLYWLTSTAYNECLDCAGRWQRGVRIEPRRAAPAEPESGIAAPEPPPAPESRAGMYGQPVPSPALVRKRPRLGAVEKASAVSASDVRLRAPLGSCRTCRVAAGVYDPRDAPPVPVPGCTCEGGCRCVIEPVGGEEPGASAQQAE